MELKKRILKVLKGYGELSTYKLTILADSYPEKINPILESLYEEKVIEKTEVRAGTYWRLKDENKTHNK